MLCEVRARKAAFVGSYSGKYRASLLALDAVTVHASSFGASQAATLSAEPRPQLYSMADCADSLGFDELLFFQLK